MGVRRASDYGMPIWKLILRCALALEQRSFWNRFQGNDIFDEGSNPMREEPHSGSNVERGTDAVPGNRGHKFSVDALLEMLA